MKIDRAKYSGRPIMMVFLLFLVIGYSLHAEAASKSIKSSFHGEVVDINHRMDLNKKDRAPKTHKHSVVFATQQNNLEEIERVLHDVSDSHSPYYGKHLTKKEIMAMTANAPATKALLHHLETAGIGVLSSTLGNEYITAEGTVEQWENMFSTEFYDFEQQNNKNVRIVRALEYSLPAALVGHVSAVFNIVHFPDPVKFAKKDVVARRTSSGSNDSKGKAISSSASNDDGEVLIADTVTPALLNNYYCIDSNTGNAETTQAVYESLDQSFSPSDLTSFQQYFNLPVEAVANDIGGHMADNACHYGQGANCIEANLDVQYLMAVSQGTPTTYYYWNGTDWMLDWLIAMTNMENPPMVNSISYSSYETSYDSSYAQQFNTEAMKLGAMGVTILSASGDDGVAGYQARGNPFYCGYYPQFPATSPYVTAVGGTMGPETGAPEIACQAQLGGVITTGGGFSTLYEAPTWQAAVLSTYFNNVASGPSNQVPVAGYVTTGRGYPDVSGLAANYAVMVSDQLEGIYGTSASTPMFSGMVSLVNAARIAAGKSSLGWINPSLYEYYKSFILVDITSGVNNCVADATVCCSQGFYAVEGWDPITGLGSVNFTAFKNVFMSLGDYPDSPTEAPSVVPGQPSKKPVATPTRAPSAKASPAPTLNPGFVYVSSFDEADCTGEVSSMYGIPTGQCFTEYDAKGHVIGYSMYSCESDVYVTVTYCSDSSCSSCSEPVSYFQGCAPEINSYYSTVTTSSSTQCSSSGTSTLPLPDGLKYAVYNQYDTKGSCSGSISNFDALMEGYCFVYETYSYKIVSFPNINFYNGNSCKGSVIQTESFDTQCTNLSYDDVYYYYYFSTSAVSEQVVQITGGSGSAPSRAPTRKPSKHPSKSPSNAPLTSPQTAPQSAPTKVPTKVPTRTPSDNPQPTKAPSTPTITNTLAPTQQKQQKTPQPTVSVNQDVEFIVTQTLQGINASTFQISFSVNADVMQNTVAQVMTGIVPSDVTVILVTPVSLASTGGQAAAGSSSSLRAVPHRKEAQQQQYQKNQKKKEKEVDKVPEVIDDEIKYFPTESIRNPNSAINQVLERFSSSMRLKEAVHSKRDAAPASVMSNRKLRSSVIKIRASGENSNACNVTYIVSFNTEQSDYTNAADGYNYMTNELQESLRDGTFNSILQSNAQLDQANDMLTVTSDEATTSDYQAVQIYPNKNGDDDSQKKARMTAIAVVVPLVVIAVVIVLIIFFMRSMKNSEEPFAEGSYNSRRAPTAVRAEPVVNPIRSQNDKSSVAQQEVPMAQATRLGSAPVASSLISEGPLRATYTDNDVFNDSITEI